MCFAARLPPVIGRMPLREVAQAAPVQGREAFAEIFGKHGNPFLVSTCENTEHLCPNEYRGSPFGKSRGPETSARATGLWYHVILVLSRPQRSGRARSPHTRLAGHHRGVDRRDGQRDVRFRLEVPPRGARPQWPPPVSGAAPAASGLREPTPPLEVPLGMDPRILIVGGGPSGAACGIELARRGLRPVIFERGPPRREKVCGDGLNFDARQALARLGVLDDVRRQAREIPRAVIWGCRGEQVAIDEVFWTLQRSELDQTLRDRVEGLGGEVRYGSRVEGAEITDGGVRLLDHRGAVHRGDMLVLATGARTRLAEGLGFRHRFRTAAALRGYVSNGAGVNAYQFWMSEDLNPGYGWAFPCPDGTLNVGVVYFECYKPGKNLRELLRGLVEGAARDTIGGSPFVAPPKGFQLRTGLRREANYRDRVLLVGENVDCTYDLSGEGIGKAMESGILAAQTIAGAGPPFRNEDLAGYQQRLLETSDQVHRGYTRAMHVIANPIGNCFFTTLLARSSKAKATLRSVIREETPPQELFSAGGLVRTVLR